LTIDSRERFSDAADLYDKHRPGYPQELLDWVVTACRLGPSGVVADVGCGTGISTRLFAARGFDVTGLDPNEAMLARARAQGGARYERGEAASTGLASRSVDVVCVAQAFHWFDIDGALQEFMRILKPGGHCAVLWNVRSQETEFMAEYDRLLRTYSREYSLLENPEKTLARLLASPRIRDSTSAVFPHLQRFDREGFWGRVFSSSYVIHGVLDRTRFEQELAQNERELTLYRQQMEALRKQVSAGRVQVGFGDQRFVESASR